MTNIKFHKVPRLGLTNKNIASEGTETNLLVGERYDFLPVVKINKSEEPKNAIISLKECPTSSKSRINLGSDYDKEHREYVVADIVIAKNSTARIPLMVKRGYDPWGFQDSDGVLEFKSSSASVKMNYIDSDDTDYKEGKTKYDLKKAEYGDELVLEINAKALARGTSFTISVYASDDKDDTFKSSNRRGKCGKFNVRVLDKDVFFKPEIDIQIEELEYIQDFADQELSPEYDENYCMQSAERGLSELLDDDKNFYSVYRKTHKHKNSIGFSGKTVYDRGNNFLKKGFVQTTHTFNKYKINKSQKELVYNSDDNDDALKNYKKVKYSIIEISKNDEKTIDSYFKNDLKNKIGYHVYYFTVTNGFHTLTLIIDNTNPCSPNYEIWDQHGITTSSGKLSEIAHEGFRKQTSWTFANTCLNRYYKNKTKYHDSTETKLWKIQRKK